MKSLLFITITLVTSFAVSQNYQNAESVEWDTVNNQWLIANGNNILTDDGEGVLGVFSNGSASHGMEVVGNILFAIDSNILKGFDLTTEQEVMSLSIPGVSFLNGMASDGNGMLWVTDFGSSRIYAVNVTDIDNPTATILVNDTGDTPNGILYDNADRLLFVTWGGNAKVRSVDLVTAVVSDIVDTGLGNLDGIVKFEGNYIISSWSPARLTRYTSDFSSSEIVDSPSLNSPADIGVNPEGVVGVPMGNNVEYVDINLLVGFNDVQLMTTDFNLSENPINESSILTFELKISQEVSITIYSVLGKKIKQLIDNVTLSGFQSVQLNKTGLTSGVYLLQIEAGTQRISKKFLVD